MGTTADKLNKLLETKAAIKQAIIDKGVDVGDDVVFADYPSKISAIESGSNDEFLALRTLNHTNYAGLFQYYYGESLDDFGIENWDTSNVTNMERAFANCYAKNYNLSNWDFSKVTTVGNMFSYSEAVNINLSSWTINTEASYYSASQMFMGCYDLETLDIRNIDTTNCQTFSFGNSFNYCNKLHTLRLDNCPNDTINKIITSTNFPTGAIEGVTRKIYINPNNRGDLTPPTNWIFVDKDTGEEIVIE